MSQYQIQIVGASRSCVIKLELDPTFPNERTVLDFVSKGMSYEPDISDVFLRTLREGDTVIDVGANIGFFTILAAALVGPSGRVVSFEPDPENFARLRANVEANGFNHVTLIEKPASAEPGPVTFFINSDDSGGSALWDPAQYPGNVRSQITRRCLTLDATTIDAEVERLGLARIKLIKVDVEGADPIVLRGARRLLSNRGVPFVLTELHAFGMEQMGTNSRMFREEIGAAGYDSFMLQYKGTLPRYIPPGTSIETSYLCNILFSSGDVIAGYWPTYVHDIYGS